MTTIRFKPINVRGGIYSDQYIVTDTGQIWNRKTNKLRKTQVDTHGYEMVNLSCNGRVKHFRVHRLVLAAFTEDRPGALVNHKDGNKLNNKLSNLEWSTVKENTRHASATGLLRDQKGESNNNSQLDSKTVRMIRVNHQYYNTPIHQLANKFNVSESTIRRILKRQTWTHA